MSAGDNTPWINEGSLRARFREEGGHLVREINQPDHGMILKEVQKERESGRKTPFLGGYKVATIPENDLPYVRQCHPDLFAKGADADLRKKALIAFSNDPRMAIYKIKKA